MTGQATSLSIQSFPALRGKGAGFQGDLSLGRILTLKKIRKVNGQEWRRCRIHSERHKQILVNCTNRKGLEWPAERPEVLEGCGPRCNSTPHPHPLPPRLHSRVLVASLEPGFYRVCGGLFLPLLQAGQFPE